MSQENLEIVKRNFADYARGDIDAATAGYDADVVFNPVEESPIHGLEAVRAYIRRWEEPWDDYEVEAEEFLDAGDRVVMTLHVKGRGAGSGVEVEARSHQVITLRDGRVIRMDEYLDRADALAAAGLQGLGR